MNSPQTLESLNESFAVPEMVRFEHGEGGLTRISITTPLATARIYLHGAHLTHFQPAGNDPSLFLSSKSTYKPGKAIRGGVPVIFPWFGDRGDGLMHGLVRTRTWEVRSVERQADQTVEIVLANGDSEDLLSIWPHRFEAQMRFGIGRDLSMTLAIANRSSDAFSFESALHTYYAVSDVRNVSLNGLQGVEYLDKNLDLKRVRETSSSIRPSGAMDRVYVNSPGALSIEDRAAARRIVIETRGAKTTVVWNPWADNIANFADLSADDWTKFLCVETANAKDNVATLAPGDVHEMSAAVRVGRMS